MTSELVFIIDQDTSHSAEVTRWLEEGGFRVQTFQNIELCLNMLDENPAVICLDVNLPGSSGLEVLKRLRLANRDIPLIVVTDNDALDSAVEAMRVGAFDYMVKPVEKIRLVTNIERAIEMHTMAHKIDRLSGELQTTYAYKNIVGQSEPIRHVFAQIEKVAEININVLIQGESGTGKELVAKAVHYGSSYKTGPFVAINCGAIPESLQESEFFGHEKGAFTGADQSRMGKIEHASNGTLFLDEVGEMSPMMQVKLLRFLQDKSFERVGGNKKITVDLRIISATNRNLEKDVESGKFREDLYYRLVVYPIVMPPLRERKEDIPLMVNHFLKKYKSDMPKTITTVTSYAMEALMRHDWRGNVRQLENVIYRAMVATRTETIQIENLPVEIQKLRLPDLPDDVSQGYREPAPSSPAIDNNPPPERPRSPSTIQEIEKQALMEALKRNNGNVPQAAKEVGVSRATFYRKIKKYQNE
ncbi:hypothetical protein UZ36_03440 [Candidatus Nitromaritima sp. SCGC AAA799-C22]|nr:hypothetical protein UZ36_03440 [Candidatus Nitromaritima sp. SCGC AAA799-C22]